MNAGTGMRARSDVRSRLASLVAATVLIGLAGAVAMAAFAGARRADSAYARFREITNEPEVIAFGGNRCPFGPPTRLSEMAALPEVVSMQPAWNTFANAYDPDGTPLIYGDETFSISVYGSEVRGPAAPHPRVLEGRLPSGPDEVVLGYGQTDAPRPAIGDSFDIVLIKVGREALITTGELAPDDLITVRVRMVGVAVMPGELDGLSGSILVSPAFADRYRPETVGCEAGLFQLRGGMNDSASFLAGVKRIEPESFGFDTSTEAVVAVRVSSLQAITLRLFGGLAAVATLLVLGQVLVRRTLLAATDAPILRALGMTRGQLVRAALLPAVAVAAGAALIAVAAAVGLSTFLPFGSVRIFEAEPGVSVDWFILLIGAVTIVAMVIACVGIPAWRTARLTGGVLGTTEFGGSERPSKVASAVASVGLPVSAVAGTRLALEPGHGRSATPVRSAIVGLTLAVTAMVAAFGFAASMDRFTSTPNLWGIRFDFASGHPFIGDRFEKKAIPVVMDEADVVDVTAGNFQEQVQVVGPAGEASIAVWGTEVLRGELIDLTMLDGRWPTADEELALGTQTARTLGVGIGDTVRVELADKSEELTLVGIPVFPDFGFGPGLGQGAGMTMGALRTFYPDVTLNLLFGRVAPGVDPKSTIDTLQADVLKVNRDLTFELPDTADLGASLTHTRKARGLPLLLAALFGAVAFATLVHVLVTSVRRRRRDLAILRTIGFTRRQIVATIAWQATTIAVVALAIGVPLGFLVGRFTWALFADRLGVVSDPVEAWVSVAIVVPAVLVVANLVAIGPAMFARRTGPAQVLRAE